MHELYDEDEVIAAVAERFGAAVAPGGVVDRGALAGARSRRPRTGSGSRGCCGRGSGPGWSRGGRSLEQASDPPRAAVVEVPLLFESGMDGAFDATIAVIADEDVRASRAAARGHEALDERSARQLTQQEKAQRATYVVVNDGTVADLESKLSAFLDMLHP